MKRHSKKRTLKDYLVPHAGNGHKPLIFTIGSVLAILITILFIQSVYVFSTRIGFNQSTFLASVLPGVLTELTNDDRVEAGIAPVVADALLTEAAQLKAEDMAARGYFAHISPDGTTPWYWFEKVGYSYTYAGENLAIDFTDSEKIEDAWMASPKHHANIVKPQYTRIGIGIAHGTYEGRDTTFVVQFFAKPSGRTATSVTPAKSVSAGPTDAQVPTKVLAEEIVPKERVLGAEMVPPPDAASFLVQVIASPLHTVTYVLAGLAALFTLLLIVALVVHVRIQFIEVIGGGLLIILAALGLMFYNIATSTGEIATDTHAAVEEQTL